jgi:penicillin amidase
VRLVPLLAVLMVAAFPGSALAVVTRAESVLPPGQSGFISQDGTTQSPHLYDQAPLYAAFQWKPAMLGLPGQSEVPRAGVTIVRDSYGVPSITGATDPDAWWGAGYAVAQDRLTELELFRRQASGRLAELFGASRLGADIVSRRDFYTPAELDKQVARLPAELRARLESYRDGVNAWIQHVRANPQDLPTEFKLFNAPLVDWTVRDSAAIGVLLARTVPSDDGKELPNARALRSAGPKAFDDLLPLRPPGMNTTVPRASGSFPSQPGRTRTDEATGLERSQVLVKKLSLPAEPVAQASRRLAIHPGGSLAVAVRDGKGGAFLHSGPQLGFAFPELFVELEVHAPGLDVRGVTAPGVPVVAAGHNAKVAWAITSGESDDDDLYAETLSGGEGYVYKGKKRAMRCRDEVIAVSGAASHTERVCRTRHGPVQARSSKQAYSRRYAIWGRELETLAGLGEVNAAADIHDVNDAVGSLTWNENLMAADGDGNIGYWHPGLLPLKPLRWDERLPYPGTGEAEWRGFLPVSKHPHVINPKGRNWLTNWNDNPSAGWTSGDIQMNSRARVAGPFHRGVYLASLVARFAKKPSFAGLQKLPRKWGTIAQQYPLARPRVVAARSKGLGQKDGLVLSALLAWDGSYAKTAGDGTVDPGVAIWREFKAQLAKRDLARYAAGAAELGGTRSTFHLFDVTNAEAHALRTLPAKSYRSAAAATFDALAKHFGTDDPDAWREPRTNITWTAQGAGSPPTTPFFDRGTWEQFVELR